MVANTVEEPPRKTRIWPYVLLAVLIATVWATISAAGGPVSIEDVPSGTPHSLGVAIGAIVGYALASAVFSAAVTTAAFHFLVFRHRGDAGKSAIAFVILMVIAFVFAAPARLLAVGAHKHKLTEAVSAWQETTRASASELGRRLQGQVASLNLNEVSLQAVERPEQVDEGLLRLRRALALEEQYRRDLQAQFEADRRELNQLQLPEEDRQRLRQAFENDFVAAAQAEADLNIRIEQKAVEVFAYLQETRSVWTIRDHRFVFLDSTALTRFNALQGEMRELVAQARARASAATPTGSAPPPQR